MERLTKYICDRAHGAEGVSAEKLTGAYCRGKFEATALVERLAAIENILGDEYDLDLVQELIQAYREGRYIILKEPEQAGISRLRELAEADREGKIPKYTIGDTVYDRFGDAWEVTSVERHLLAGEPKWIYRCGHAGTNDYCALWEFEVLTRAEAEAALRREQE